ncbi:chemotaxis protein CheC [Geomonas sp. Red32]|uniref:chemotaxis protein CheC n=1 Tax=Geomonas sp. Red32 TaxID=2912856 RepID=UPI00202CE2C4|nr:chemotaxis protein CheC [Geomonas sp. Red32]MCM0081304.1 chemotaxis protein CheC [Geomonas sp. Red32]
MSILKPAELDALTEACNIGMGHAATALSQLMGKGVDIEAPRLRLVESAAASGVMETEPVLGLSLQILGNVRGSILVLLKERDARRMLELLLGKDFQGKNLLSELEVSTLKEIGNILASACLNALGNMLKMTLLPSIPTLVSGQAGSIVGEMAGQGSRQEPVVMVDTVFSISEALCGGSLFLMPAKESLAAIVAGLGAR